MAKTLLPGGLYSKFDLKEDGWNDEVNMNFQKLDALIGSCVLDVLTPLPTTGADGDKYIDSATQEIAVWYCNKWNKFAAPCAWEFKNLSDGTFNYYDENGVLTPAATGGGGADNLGNHTAVTTLEMSNNDIANAKDITTNTLVAADSIAVSPGGFERFCVNNSGGMAFGFRESGAATLSTNGKNLYALNPGSNAGIVVTLSDFDKNMDTNLKSHIITFTETDALSPTNPITFVAESGTINGSSAPLTLDQSYKSLSFFSDGTNWFTIEPMAAPAAGGAPFTALLDYTAGTSSIANNTGIYNHIASTVNQSVTLPETGNYLLEYSGGYNRSTGGAFIQRVKWGIALDEPTDTTVTQATVIGMNGIHATLDDSLSYSSQSVITNLTAGSHAFRPVWQRVNAQQACNIYAGMTFTIKITKVA